MLRYLTSAALVLTSLHVAGAAPGDVDLTFNAGTFINDQGSGIWVNTIATQPDGKIIVAGRFEKINGVPGWSIARVNNDGSLDSSFSSPFVYSSSDPVVGKAVVQSDGKIVVGGILHVASGTKNVVRLNSDGTIDSTFSANWPNPPGYVYEIAVQSDGKILVSGDFSGIYRLNANGSPDTSFGTFLSSISGLVLQPNGYVVAGGYYSTASTFVVERFQPTGQIDSTFHGGTLLFANGPITDLELQADGQIIVSGGFTQIDSASKSRLARLTSSGSIDSGFTTTLSLGSVVDTNIQSDGKIFAVGRFFFSGDSMAYVTARFNSDGSTDSSFLRIAESTPSDAVTNAALQADGKMLVGGSFGSLNGIARERVARLFNSDPAPVPTSAVSRKIHGDAGPFNVDLPLSGTPGIEFRSGGATGDHTVVVTFDINVTINGSPQAAVTSGTGDVGSNGVSNGGMVTVSDNVVTVPLTNVANAQTIGITLYSVNGGANVVIPMSVLVGDVTGNGEVNSTDVVQTQSQSGQPVTASNFMADVTLNGVINSSDISMVQSLSGTGLTASAPASASMPAPSPVIKSIDSSFSKHRRLHRRR